MRFLAKRFLAKVSVAVALAIALCGNAFVAGAQAAPPADVDVDVPAPLGDVAVTLPLLVDRLHAGELTVHKAWESGELSLGDALYLLGHASDWGAIEGRDNVDLRHALAKLILEQDKGRLKKLKQMPPKARLWIGDYLQVQQDARAVQVLESVLGELKAPVAGYPLQALLFLSIERLARHYSGTGQHAKAAEMWLRLAPLLSEENWMVPDAFVEAGWAYARAGDDDKAEQAYARVRQHSWTWAAHSSMWGTARVLIRQERHEDLRKLLSLPLVADREQRQPAVSSLMATSYYRMGDFPSAKKWSEVAIAQYEALKFQAPKMGLDVAYNESHERLSWIREWGQHPFVCWPPQLNFPPPTAKDNFRRFNVRSFRDLPLTVSVDNPQVKASVVDKWQEAENGFAYDREVSVEVEPEAMQKPLSVVITISSTRFPNFKEQVQVLVAGTTAKKVKSQ